MIPARCRRQVDVRDPRAGSRATTAAADMAMAVFARGAVATGRAALTAMERDELVRLQLHGPRAAEWIAGRVAAHRLLDPGASVLSDADGAPRVVRALQARPGELARPHVSLSHDGGWVAVAVGARPVAIDVCDAEHAGRVERIVARLGVATRDPLRAWTALECALKLRRLGIWTLLDRGLAVDGDVVSGIGAPIRVAWHVTPSFVACWSREAA